MAKSYSYLHGLKFDPKLKQTFIAKYLLNFRLVLLLTLVIIGVGLYSFFTLPRTLNPDIKIAIVIVNVVLPGAGPQDVESLVTVPVEDAVSGVANVDTVTSSSVNSDSITTIQFLSGVDPDKALSDVQTAVNGITTLPKTAQTPSVKKLDFTNAPIWTFSLSSSGDTGSLMRYAKILKDKIKALQSIKEVSLNGFVEQEIQVVIKPESIGTYGLNPLQISQAIATSIQSFPAGTVSTDKSTYALTIDQSAASMEDLRNLQVNLNNAVVPLSQIADIYERPKPDQNMSYISSPHSSPKLSVTFNVFKNKTVNIDKAYADTKQIVDNEYPIHSGQFKVQTVISTAQQITTQFGDLTRDFIITISLVFLVLFIFLGMRQAIIASLAIPITFLISFTIMNATGIALSFISLFSLLLALGLLVDDTIVVVSAITSYYRTGKFSSSEAGLLVWRDFLLPILTTTITTVWAFFPLLLSTGIIGEFIKPIPIVVSTSLIASFFVAMLITLPFVIFLLEPEFPLRVKIFLRVLFYVGIIVFVLLLLPKGKLFVLELIGFLALAFSFYILRDLVALELRKIRFKLRQKIKFKINLNHYINNGVIHFEKISNRYHRFIISIISSKFKRRTAIIMAVIFTVFAYLLLPLGFVKNEFFPKSDQDFVFFSLELPAGTTEQTSEIYAAKFLNELRNTPGTEFVTADIGQTESAATGNGPNIGGGSNNILFTLVLFPKGQRNVSSIDIGPLLRDKYKNFQDGKISVVESSGGPPAGADIQIKLFGDDLNKLNSYADNIQSYLKTIPGVVSIDKSVKPGTSKLAFVPDNKKISELNITTDTLGMWLRLFSSGLTVNSVKFVANGNDKEDITLRMFPKTQNPETVGNITIPSSDQSGNQKSNNNLINLGTLQLENNPTVITREKSKRTISVSASVTKGYSISTINSQLEKYANSLHLPSGYSWSTGGVNEENQKSVQSILAAMLLSFILIIVTMVVQFASFRRALIVMLVIPLSISGVFIIFAISNTPLSFPALIGVLALFGIVVKNAILVVDKIVQNRKAGFDLITSIADASSSRLEAIALTSIATIIGLIPITLSDPLWQGLGGAIISGLFFSGTIMLFIIPVIYFYWFNEKVTNK